MSSAVSSSGAIITLKHIFGLKGDVANNIHYLDETHVLYPAGYNVPVYDLDKKTQRFLPLTSPSALDTVSSGDISAMAMCSLSQQATSKAAASGGADQSGRVKRKILAVAERGEAGKASVSLFDPASGKRLGKGGFISSPEIASTEIVSMDISPDGKHLLTQGGAPDWTLINWAHEKSKPLQIAKVSNQSGAVIHQVSYCPADPSVVCVTGNGILRFLHIEQNEFKSIPFSMGKREPQNYLCHCWIDDRILVGTDSGDILVFENAEFRGVLESSPAGGKSIDCIAAYSKGFVIGMDEGYIMIFDRDSQEIYKYAKSFQIDQNFVKVKSIAISPSEDYCVCTLENNQAYVLGLSNTDILKSEEMNFEPLAMPFHHMQITGLDVCIRKPLLATCGMDRSVRIWNYNTRSVEVTRFFNEQPHSVAFHPSGLHILVGFTDNLRMLNILMDDCIPVRDFAIKGCKECQFSHGGQYFAAANGSVIQVFATYTCEMLGSFNVHKAKVRSIAWLSDDSAILSAGMDGQVFTTKIKSGEHVAVAKHKCNYTCAVSSSDGKVYAVGSDRHLKVILESTLQAELNCGVVLTQLCTQVPRPPLKDRFLFAGTDTGVIRVFPIPVEGKCFADDTRILTSRGFLFVEEIEALPASQRDELQFSCYDVARGALVYRAGQLTTPAGPKRLVDVTQANYRSALAGKGEAKARTNHLSIRVSDDHDLFVQVGSRCGSKGQAIWPRSGGTEVPAGKVTPAAVASLEEEKGNCVLRFQSLAPNGHVTVASEAGAPEESWPQSLGLDTHQKTNAFLSMYGFWLGDGTLRFFPGQQPIISFCQMKSDDIEWLRATLRDAGLLESEMVEYQFGDGTTEIHVAKQSWCDYFAAEYWIKYSTGRAWHRHLVDEWECVTCAEWNEHEDAACTNCTKPRDSFPMAVHAEDPPVASESDSDHTVSASDVAVAMDLDDGGALAGGDEDMSGRPSEFSDSFSPASSSASSAGMRFTPSELREIAHLKHQGVSSPDENSAKWLWDWMLRRSLGKEQLRLIIRGLRRADGIEASDENTILTSNAMFRDQLVHACLHAGFSAYFFVMYEAGAIRGYNKVGKATGRVYHPHELTEAQKANAAMFRPITATATNYAVCYSEATTNSGRRAAYPSLDASEIEPVPDYKGRFWCVTVDHPDHLVVVQRAWKNVDGVVTAASQAIIIGQCYDQQVHTGAITRMRCSPDDNYLFTVGEDGCLTISQIEQKRDASSTRSRLGHGGDHTLQWAEEILVNRSDLEEKMAILSDLQSKVTELMVHNDTTLSLKDLAYKEKLRDTTDKFNSELESDKHRYHALEDEKEQLEKSYALKVDQLNSMQKSKMHELDSHHQFKLQQEQERFLEMKQRGTAQRQQCEDEMSAQDEQCLVDRNRLSDEYEAKIQEARQLKLNIMIERESKRSEMQEDTFLTETAADEEIDAVKLEADKKLTTERLTKLCLKDENAIFKRKFASLREDITENLDDLSRMKDKQQALYDTIDTLEKDIKGHVKEIKERESTIEDKRHRIFELRKKNQELEKFKFVLDYKITELKRQIQPRKQEMKELNEQITEMEKELKNYKKESADLQLDVTELNLKYNGMEANTTKELADREEVAARLAHFKTELHEVFQDIEDAKKLKDGIKRLFQRHVQNAEKEARRAEKKELANTAGKEIPTMPGTAAAAAAGPGHLFKAAASVDDVHNDYQRQRHYLERSIDSHNAKCKKDMRVHIKEHTRIMQENIALTKEVNELRREKYHILVQQKSKEQTTKRPPGGAGGRAAKLSKTLSEGMAGSVGLADGDETEVQQEQIRALKKQLALLEGEYTDLVHVSGAGKQPLSGSISSRLYGDHKLPQIGSSTAGGRTLAASSSSSAIPSDELADVNSSLASWRIDAKGDEEKSER